MNDNLESYSSIELFIYIYCSSFFQYLQFPQRTQQENKLLSQSIRILRNVFWSPTSKGDCTLWVSLSSCIWLFEFCMILKNYAQTVGICTKCYFITKKSSKLNRHEKWIPYFVTELAQRALIGTWEGNVFFIHFRVYIFLSFVLCQYDQFTLMTHVSCQCSYRHFRVHLSRNTRWATKAMRRWYFRPVETQPGKWVLSTLVVRSFYVKAGLLLLMKIISGYEIFANLNCWTDSKCLFTYYAGKRAPIEETKMWLQQVGKILTARWFLFTSTKMDRKSKRIVSNEHWNIRAVSEKWKHKSMSVKTT